MIKTGLFVYKHFDITMRARFRLLLQTYSTQSLRISRKKCSLSSCLFRIALLLGSLKKKEKKIGFGPQSCGKMKWVASPRGEKRMSLLGFFCGKKLHTSHVKLEENHSSMSSHEWLLFLDQTLFMY